MATTQQCTDSTPRAAALIRRVISGLSNRIRLSACVAPVAAVDVYAVAQNAECEQCQRSRQDLEYFVQSQPIHGCVEPMHQRGQPTRVAVFDATAGQPEAHSFGHAEMSPISIAKPKVDLQTDEVQECRKAAVAQHGAERAGNAQQDHAAVRGCLRAGRRFRTHGAPTAPDGHALTSSLEICPDSPCKSEGFSNPSVGLRSMSIQ